MICGGVYPGTSRTCLELTQSGAGWKKYSSTLSESRTGHSAWKSPDGIVLLGGYHSGDTTELVTREDISSKFSLNTNIRDACAISDGVHVVITGGSGNRRNVSVYSMSGFNKTLPQLSVGRQYHACALYRDEHGVKVNICKSIWNFLHF